MSTIRLLLTGNSTDEHDESGNYAIVELTEDDLKSLASKRKAFMEALEKDKDLFDHRFRSHDATFYANIDFIVDEDDDPENSVDAAEMLDESAYMFLAEKDKLCGGQEVSETDLDLVVIDATGVFWEGQGSDTTNTYTTEMVEWKEIFDGRL